MAKLVQHNFNQLLDGFLHNFKYEFLGYWESFPQKLVFRTKIRNFFKDSH